MIERPTRYIDRIKGTACECIACMRLMELVRWIDYLEGRLSDEQ